MVYVTRNQENRIVRAFAQPFITTILGPRRVGKTTLIDHYLEQNPTLSVVQLNMDKMGEREQVKAGQLEAMILQSIRRHIVAHQRIWVTIDEAQKCPELFEQIKVLYDQYKDQDAIKFILTGSALLELHRLSAESLAGRAQLYYLGPFNLGEALSALHKVTFEHPLLDLLPLTEEPDEEIWQQALYHRIPFVPLLKKTLSELLVFGGLPEVITLTNPEDKIDYLANYLQTYLEKDVRAIGSITDLRLYRHLMDILAEQTGSLREDTKILQALGCHRDTLNKYRGCLQATLLYQEIHPYINSTLKRLVKSPKGYIVDNGLISFLQGFTDLTILQKTGQIGHRFENWFINELTSFLNQYAGKHELHYWRTTGGAEVDLIVNKPPHVLPFEITYSQMIDSKKVNNLLRFKKYEPKARYGFYIYMGEFKIDYKNKIIFIPGWMIC